METIPARFRGHSRQLSSSARHSGREDECESSRATPEADAMDVDADTVLEHIHCNRRLPFTIKLKTSKNLEKPEKYQKTQKNPENPENPGTTFRL